ncbi:uncharacterized protein ISCGN_032545 [Ixodes scapularis]
MDSLPQVPVGDFRRHDDVKQATWIYDSPRFIKENPSTSTTPAAPDVKGWQFSEFSSGHGSSATAAMAYKPCFFVPQVLLPLLAYCASRYNGFAFDFITMDSLPQVPVGDFRRHDDVKQATWIYDSPRFIKENPSTSTTPAAPDVKGWQFSEFSSGHGSSATAAMAYKPCFFVPQVLLPLLAYCASRYNGFAFDFITMDSLPQVPVGDFRRHDDVKQATWIYDSPRFIKENPSTSTTPAAPDVKGWQFSEFSSGHGSSATAAMAYKPCFFVPQVLLPLLAYCASRYNGFAFDFITMDSLPQVPVGDFRRHDDVKQATWIYDSPRFIKENPSTSTTPAAPDVKGWQFSEFSSGHGSSATAAMAYKPCFFVPQVLLPLLAYCASRYNGFAFDFITMDSLPQVPVGDFRRHDDVKQATWIYDSPRFIKENPSTSTTPAAPDVKGWQFSEFSSGHGSSATAAMAYKPCFFVPQVLLPLLAYCASRYNGFAFDFITMDSLPQVPVGDFRRHDDVKQATWIYDSPRFIKENPSTSTTPAAPDVKGWQFSEFFSGHGSSATAAMAYKPCFFVPQVLLPLLAYCASRYNGFAFDFITMDSLPQVPVGDFRRHDDVKQATWIYDSPRFIKENPSTSTTPAAPDVKGWQFSEFSSGHGSSATAAMAYKPCFFVPQVLLPLLAYCASRYNGFAFDFITMDSLPQVPVGDFRRHDDVKQATWIYDSPRFIKENPSTSTTPAAPDVKGWQFSEFSSGHGSSATAAMAYKPCFFVPQVLLPLLAYCASRYNGFAFDFITMDSLPQVPVGDFRRHDDVKQATWIYDSPRFIKENPSTSTTPAAPDVKGWQFSEFSSGHGSSATAAMAYQPCFFVPQPGPARGPKGTLSELGKLRRRWGEEDGAESGLTNDTRTADRERGATAADVLTVDSPRSSCVEAPLPRGRSDGGRTSKREIAPDVKKEPPTVKAVLRTVWVNNIRRSIPPSNHPRCICVYVGIVVTL